MRIKLFTTLLLVIMSVVCAACAAPPPPAAEPVSTPTTPTRMKVGVAVGSSGPNDRSFNQYTLEGARKAAADHNLAFTFLVGEATANYEDTIEQLVVDGCDLVICIGFTMSNAMARVASNYPNVRFAIVDSMYLPGAGCSDTVEDCYTEDGGFANVTSLMFAEEQVAYLAGVLAACMSKNGKVASIAGMEIPPVVRFVKGFQNGAHAFNPDIVVFNQYHPSFNDPTSGKVTAQDFIRQGTDVIFGVGGQTGNGALQAAHEADVMAIGVDVDQYLTYAEVRSSLLTSASKHVDQAAEDLVTAFANDTLTAGVRLATLANDGVGLSPYHDWEDNIPQECKDAVETTKKAIIARPSITGVNGYQ